MKTNLRAVGLLAVAALAGCAYPSARREAIATPKAPAAIGPYSQAIRAGDAVWVAGQLGLDPATGKMVEGGIEGETRQALENVRAILSAAGLGLEDVAQTQVFLADLDDFQAMNAVYAGFFPKAPPARATVQVAKLPKGARVEILAVAVRTSR
jgi:2-iminobutanoate/2-iminopropanoate deaminase